jgi:hypothetical protein
MGHSELLLTLLERLKPEESDDSREIDGGPNRVDWFWTG